jgi:CHAD domain-containing protein
VAATRRGNGVRQVFTATYHDTPDRRLAHASISLSRRLENGVGLWEAKIGDVVVAAPGGPADLPDVLMRRLRAPLHRGRLEAVARLRSGTDDVALLEGQRVVQTFPDLDTAIRNAIAEPAVDRPAKKPASERVRAYIVEQVAEVERTDPIVRVDPTDHKALHDLRVAVRRLRAVLRATRELFDGGWVTSVRDELRWFGRELAPARDLDVLLEGLPKTDKDVAPVVRALEAERKRERKRIVKVLESERYGRLLDRLREAVEPPPMRPVDLPLERVAAREFEQLRGAMRSLGANPTDAALHQARIRAKRARYAAELAAPAVGKRARKFINAAKSFQDVVGAHQDAVVAERHFRALAAEERAPAVSFAAGRLVERERLRRVRARSSVRPAWKRLRKRGRTAWA